MAKDALYNLSPNMVLFNVSEVHGKMLSIMESSMTVTRDSFQGPMCLACR